MIMFCDGLYIIVRCGGGLYIIVCCGGGLYILYVVVVVYGGLRERTL